jgi:hypothetical protein
MTSSQTLVPGYGGWTQCVALIEQTAKVSQLIRISTVIDSEFGVNATSTTRDLMTQAIEADSKELCALSGYAHLFLAERMHHQGFDKDSVNRELDKAEALLDFARLGGRHPWLPRAQRLRRRLNLVAYLRLGGIFISLLALLLAIGGIYRYARSSDLSFFCAPSFNDTRIGVSDLPGLMIGFIRC